MKKTDRLVKVLERAQQKLWKAEGDLVSILYAHSDYEIGLDYQPSDGWVATDGKSNVCPLDIVLKEFEETGRVTHEHFLDNAI